MEGTFSLVLPLRLILGSILLIAGIEKLRDLSSFVAGVQQYKVLPVNLAGWYGRLLPFIELSAGVLLFFWCATSIYSASLGGNVCFLRPGCNN